MKIIVVVAPSSLDIVKTLKITIYLFFRHPDVPREFGVNFDKFPVTFFLFEPNPYIIFSCYSFSRFSIAFLLRHARVLAWAFVV